MPNAVGQLNLCVVRNGSGGSCVEISSLPEAPAVFQVAASPEQLVPAITHSDGSLVTGENPAKNGEWLTIYANGFGVNFKGPGAPTPGEAAPTNPLAVFNLVDPIEIDGEPVPVNFAGLAPGLVRLAQLNFKLERLADPDELFPTALLDVRVKGATRQGSISLLPVNNLPTLSCADLNIEPEAIQAAVAKAFEGAEDNWEESFPRIIDKVERRLGCRLREGPGAVLDLPLGGLAEPSGKDSIESLFKEQNSQRNINGSSQKCMQLDRG